MLWLNSVPSSDGKLLKSQTYSMYLNKHYGYQNYCYLVIFGSVESIWFNIRVQDGDKGLCVLKQAIAVGRMVRDNIVGKYLLTSSELGMIFRASQVLHV